MRTALLTIASLAAATVAVAAHAFEAKPGPESCRNAHALVVASASGKHDFIWSEIRKVLRQGNGRWRIVDDYEPGVSQRVSLRQYDTKHHAGGIAYVVHCGFGGDCNDFIKAFFEAHNDWYSPEVFCGVVPSALENGRQPAN